MKSVLRVVFEASVSPYDTYVEVRPGDFQSGARIMCKSSLSIQLGGPCAVGIILDGSPIVVGVVTKFPMLCGRYYARHGPFIRSEHPDGRVTKWSLFAVGTVQALVK